MSTTLKENIHWVGFVDWNIRDFHSYHTTKGATYNSYLITDEKTALIDTVKAPFWKDLLNNIKKLADPNKVDYIVCNHAEPDHSGALPEIVKNIPNAKVVCDKKCSEILSAYYDTSNWNFEIVKTGDTISLGKKTLSFLETPLVHWPESLMTYIPEDKLLFSMDGFGQHYATSFRFDDEVELEEVMKQAKTYYANIVMPYGKQVGNTLKAAGTLDIEMIAPSHGLIWRTHVDKIVKAYQDWAINKPKCKVAVVYDTMWNSTELMAKAIYEGARDSDVEATFLKIREVGNTALATEIFDSACVAWGSATLNQGMMPDVASILTYMQGLKADGKSGFAFGSFGWGRGAPEAINKYLEEMKYDIIIPPLKAKWLPEEDVLQSCYEAGIHLAAKAKEITGSN